MQEDEHEPLMLSAPDWAALPNRQVTLSGVSAPWSRIVIRDWLAAVSWCTADETGRWMTTVTGLYTGAHVFVAECVDHEGNLVAASPPLTIEVPHRSDGDAQSDHPVHSGGPIGRLLGRRRRAGPAPSHTSPVQAEEVGGEGDAPDEPEEMEHPAPSPSPGQDTRLPEIVHPASGSRVGRTLTLYGTSSANSAIDVLDGATPVAATESDDAGYWTATLKSLTPGIHQVRARSSADNSAENLVSTPVAVVVGELAGANPTAGR
jgi:hypothetical protein